MNHARATVKRLQLERPVAERAVDDFLGRRLVPEVALGIEDQVARRGVRDVRLEAADQRVRLLLVGALSPHDPLDQLDQLLAVHQMIDFAARAAPRSWIVGVVESAIQMLDSAARAATRPWIVDA